MNGITINDKQYIYSQLKVATVKTVCFMKKIIAE